MPALFVSYNNRDRTVRQSTAILLCNLYQIFGPAFEDVLEAEWGGSSGPPR